MAMCFLYLGLGSWEPSTFTSYFGLQNPRPDRSIQECKPLCSTLANRNVQNWTCKKHLKKLWRPEVRRLKQSCAKICKSNILYKSWNLTIACMIIYAICIYYNRYFIWSFSLRWHWPPRWPPSPQVAIKKVLIFDPDQKKRLDTEAAIMKAGVRWTVEEGSKLKSPSDALLASGFGPSTYLQTDGNLWEGQLLGDNQPNILGGIGLQPCLQFSFLGCMMGDPKLLG